LRWQAFGRSRAANSSSDLSISVPQLEGGFGGADEQRSMAEELVSVWALLEAFGAPTSGSAPDGLMSWYFGFGVWLSASHAVSC
jgi:hypothetical protein